MSKQIDIEPIQEGNAEVAAEIKKIENDRYNRRAQVLNEESFRRFSAAVAAAQKKLKKEDQTMSSIKA